MKTYPEYKASGIDWLGDVPSYWAVSKLRYVATLNPSATLMVDDSLNVSYLPMERLGFGVAHPSTIKMRDRTSGLNYFEEGDVLLAKVTPCFENGKIAIAQNLTNSCGIGSSEIFVFRCNNINNKYFFYLLQNGYIKEELVSTMQGTGGLKRISPDFVRNMYITIPPIDEQEQIAAYLDDVAGKIDELIKEKQAQLDDIRAYRTSLITEAVTRGLNPDAPLKDSGIDWLGEIPSHWITLPLKAILSKSNSGIWGDEAKHDGTDVVCFRVADFDYPHLRLKYDNLTYRNVPLHQLNGREVRYGDIVIEKSGGGELSPVGRAVISFFEGIATCSNFMHVISVGDKANNLFINYLLASIYSQGLSRLYFAQTTGIQNLNIKEYLSQAIALPPIEEQEQIAAYLDDVTAMIDELIESLSKQIEDLAEYKRAVITEAVTGKVDVRDWQPKP